MPQELTVPTLGESISEVQIGQWLKREGDSAGKDDPLVELESDKATVELPAPSAGRLQRVLKQQGETAAIGEAIAIWEPATDGASPAPAKKIATPTPSAPRAEQRAAPVTAPAPAEVESKQPVAPQPSESLRSPLAVEAPKPAAPAAGEKPGGLRLPLAEKAAETASAPADGRGQRIVPMSSIRRRIAERLVEAQQSAALLTTFNEIDMGEVVALRQRHKEGFQQRHGVKLGFVSFFVRAACDALRQFPQLNAQIRGTDIVYHDYADIGIAVGAGKGLVVPVLRNAERLGLAEIERRIADFATRAAANQIQPDELAGGTFTISNGGVYGSLLSTPIVNPPQSGILGLHAIQDRPVARDGQVVIRPMMYVALTYDHRLIDGREAVTFLRRIKEVIEEPARLLLEV
jgi:2-oxoglutarate dehydrogenase E2 component (dihydrolipoamide succinyltransferase)